MTPKRSRTVSALRSVWSTGGPSAQDLVSRRRSTDPGRGFATLPAPAGPYPYRRRLDDVLGPQQAREIRAEGVLRFHSAGDTGGHLDPGPQRRVACAMAAELAGPGAARFFYHLGDVVYPHGEAANYRAQFYSPYAEYAAPIFAVPGNHDAEGWPEQGDTTLGPFVAAFQSTSPALHDAALPPRPPVAQPHVYWTLEHDWIRIVGAYSNVPEGGQFDHEQLDWLIDEFEATPPDVTLVLAMHQPPLSADLVHGSNLELAELIDACAVEAGRGPDAVFGGHSHSYQRFSRRTDGRAIPHVVAGAGGFHELHEIGRGVGEVPVSFKSLKGITLHAYEDRAHGFMTVAARPGGADVTYTAIARGRNEIVDAFVIRPPA